MNKIIISGRLCKDPEIRQTQSGTMVVSFDFAVNRRFKRDGDPDADFFRCTSFGKTAEVFQKCRIAKGTKLLLEGEIQNNNYTDKNGVKHYSMQVIVSSVEFCESKSSGQNQQAAYTGYGSNAPYGVPQQTYKQESIGPDGFAPIEDGFDEEQLPF